MALKVRISIAISSDLLQDVDRLADAQGRSRSDYIERCVRDQSQGESTTIKILSNPLVGPAMVRAFADPGVLRGIADALGEKLSDQQLDLFHNAMQKFSSEAAAEAEAPKPKGKRRPGKFSEHKKRGKAK